MKHSLFLLFSILTLHVAGQKSNKKKAEPTYFLDSVKVKSLGIFDINKVESINVVNDNDTATPGGKIYIKLKNSSNVKFITASEIAKINKVTIDSPAIFMLDNHLINDTSIFSIDSSYIVRVEVVNPINGTFAPKNLTDLRILRIITPEYIDKQSKKKKKQL